MKMKVLFIDESHPLLEERLKTMGFDCHSFTGTYDDLKNIIENYAGLIVRSRLLIDRPLLDKAKTLRFIGRVGAGLESIDLNYAQEKGIACFNSPEGNRDAVGEHTLGLLLCLLNKICMADNLIRNGIRQREACRGIEIMGKTIGIIGYGNMGAAFAQRLSGFGAQVLAYDKYKRGFSDTFAKESSLDTLYNEADIISFHVPLTAETHHMADDAFFSKCRKDFFLLNTSRGPVVKTDDLVTALKSGKIKGAGLDVIEYESYSFETLAAEELPPSYTYLLNAQNVIMTPHVAGWTNESKVKLAQVLADKIEFFLAQTKS